MHRIQPLCCIFLEITTNHTPYSTHRRVAGRATEH